MESGMEVKIDKGIPVPKSKWNSEKFPFSKMEVGDSFFVAGYKPKNIAGSLEHQRKRYNKRFISRTLGSGIRVWRLK